jgi:hypothetical protein
VEVGRLAPGLVSWFPGKCMVLGSELTGMLTPWPACKLTNLLVNLLACCLACCHVNQPARQHARPARHRAIGLPSRQQAVLIVIRPVYLSTCQLVYLLSRLTHIILAIMDGYC